MTASDVSWCLWLDTAHSPFMNMALDEALLLNLEGAYPVARFYEWDRPCFSIGCFQSADAAPADTVFVRRPTGGGVVDHRHDFTYTVIVPASHPICRLSREASYAAVNDRVIQALKALNVDAELTRRTIPDHVDRRTMVCFTHPTKYDVVLGGTKIAGAAQRRRKEGILHQGSVDMGPLPTVTRPALREALQHAFTRLFGGAACPFTPSPDTLRQARSLAENVFSRDDWNIAKKHLRSPLKS
ncbi:MAG: hypothetical protein RRC34_11565 [Lentisphaeria bacterium]|nr:hypothetical protein [Lentisphaeria bacterium]